MQGSCSTYGHYVICLKNVSPCLQAVEVDICCYIGASHQVAIEKVKVYYVGSSCLDTHAWECYHDMLREKKEAAGWNELLIGITTGKGINASPGLLQRMQAQ